MPLVRPAVIAFLEEELSIKARRLGFGGGGGFLTQKKIENAHMQYIIFVSCWFSGICLTFHAYFFKFMNRCGHFSTAWK